MANPTPMTTGFTVVKTSGMKLPRFDAGGSLKPSTNGFFVEVSPGAENHSGSDKRSHLRLVE